MTVKFETVFDALRTKVAALTGFSGKIELPNPYDQGLNPEPMLRDGWGLTVGGSGLGPTEYNSIVDRHEFGIVLTREVLSTQNDSAPLIAAIKAIKADATLLQRSLDGGTLLNLPNDLEQFAYSSTSPIRFGEGERHKWVTITVTFLASIRETLT
jgi:hypothetical protein